MNTIGINNINFTAQLSLTNKKNTPPENRITGEKTSYEFTPLVPGFNDHNVILFGKNKAKNKIAFSGVQPYQPLDQVESNTMKLYQDIAPAVVRISVKKEEIVSNFFGDHTETINGTGSGSIIDKNGYVLTNHHVVANNKQIKVDVGTKVYDAQVIGSDATTDISLLKLIAPPEELAQLPSIKIGTSNNLVGGQRVSTFGSPYGIDTSMTQGIISGLNRKSISPNGRITNGMIQTDSAANPGSSGGPLVNSKGEQIGIVSQIQSMSGSSAGITYAIPIDEAMKVAKELIANGRVIRPFIGLKGGLPVKALPPILKEELGINLDKGVWIQGLLPDGPAAVAGLRGPEMFANIALGSRLLNLGLDGDIITKINDKDVNSMTDIFTILEESKIGSQLSVEYISPVLMANELKMSAPKTTTIKIEKTPKGVDDKAI